MLLICTLPTYILHDGGVPLVAATFPRYSLGTHSLCVEIQAHCMVTECEVVGLAIHPHRADYNNYICLVLYLKWIIHSMQLMQVRYKLCN